MLLKSGCEKQKPHALTSLRKMDKKIQPELVRHNTCIAPLLINKQSLNNTNCQLVISKIYGFQWKTVIGKLIARAMGVDKQKKRTRRKFSFFQSTKEKTCGYLRPVVVSFAVLRELLIDEIMASFVLTF